MYLLIRMRPWFLKEERLNLHPTMYLLILPFPVSEYSMMILFTSHYVSINSCVRDIRPRFPDNLHPTMYLLILALSVIP